MTWMPPLLPAGKLVPPLTTAGTRIPPLATAALSLNRQYQRRDRRERGCTANSNGGTGEREAVPLFLLAGHANVAVPPLPPAEHLDGTRASVHMHAESFLCRLGMLNHFYAVYARLGLTCKNQFFFCDTG